MAAVFADSGYWIALLGARDQLHERASSLTSSLGGDEIVTTELVLVETFNHVAAGGPTARRLAVALLRLCSSPPSPLPLPLGGRGSDGFPPSRE